MDNITIPGNALAVVAGLVSIGTPLVMLVYNAGKMRSQLKHMQDDFGDLRENVHDDIKELRDLVIEHIQDHMKQR